MSVIDDTIWLAYCLEALENRPARAGSLELTEATLGRMVLSVVVRPVTCHVNNHMTIDKFKVYRLRK